MAGIWAKSRQLGMCNRVGSSKSHENTPWDLRVGCENTNELRATFNFCMLFLVGRSSAMWVTNPVNTTIAPSIERICMMASVSSYTSSYELLYWKGNSGQFNLWKSQQVFIPRFMTDEWWGLGRFTVNDARNIIPNTFEVGSPVNWASTICVHGWTWRTQKIHRKRHRNGDIYCI